MERYLLAAAIIILICVLFHRISSEFGVPSLFVFIVLGMIFGSDGVFGIEFTNYVFAEQVCSVALIIIIFYGGFGTNWNEAKPVAVKAALLSSLGVILTALLVGLFCHFVMKIGFLESMLIGSVISSTDAASVFSILRSKKLGLRDNTASMLEVESGSNDPCSYMLTAMVLSIMGGNASAEGIAYTAFAQIAYSIIAAVGVAYCVRYLLQRYRFVPAGFDTTFMLGVAMMSYALPAVFGGNGYLSAYIVGIILGNSDIKNKLSLIHFFDGITGIAQMLIFFLLGLLSFPSQMVPILIPAFCIALFLTFVARPLAVFAILTPAKCGFRQQLLVSFAGLRGAASIVFAVMVTVSDAYTQNDVFHIAFCIVLISIIFQGSLLPWVSRKLNMIDPNANVLKTFNDYTEEVDVQFIRLSIDFDHPWRDKMVREIILPPETLLVMIIRDKSQAIPSGNTCICENDICVLSAPAFQGESADIRLVEHKIAHDSKWIGANISDFSPDPNELVIMIKRGEKTIIPRGQTKLQADDILVINMVK